jgi:hypothetical protein
VEVGETYFGPKDRVTTRTKKGKSGLAPKHAVVALVERGGEVRMFYAEKATPPKCATSWSATSRERQGATAGAWCHVQDRVRMGQHIRMLIEKADPNDLLTGHIEVDEAYVGGVRSGGKRGRGAPGKTIVLGMAERGGRIQAKVIPTSARRPCGMRCLRT